jgi:hypothetical protein
MTMLHRDVDVSATLSASPTAPGLGSVSHYRQGGGRHVIDVSASTVAELFSGLDPAPFRHKDLDPQVESYILAAVREVGGADRAKIAFHPPDEQSTSVAGICLPDAVHNYFAYREWVAGEDLARLARTGGVSLVIGLSFLFACLALRQLFRGNGAAGVAIGEGLLIVGWVALWRPLDIALYDWWPIWLQRRLFAKLKSIPVACVATAS